MMVQKFVVYICTYCNTEYLTHASAYDCELRHKELDAA